MNPLAFCHPIAIPSSQYKNKMHLLPAQKECRDGLQIIAAAGLRPTHHIRYSEVTRHLWGDAETGFVDDWIYASTDKIHQLVFGLPGGGNFNRSQDFRTVFGADEVLYMLSGTFGRRQSGDRRGPRVKAGEAVFFCTTASASPLNRCAY